MNIKKFFKQYLNEEFRLGMKKDGKYYEIYACTPKSPLNYDDKKSLKKLEHLRFALNLKDGTLYLWDSDLLHAYADEELKLGYSNPYTYILWGEAMFHEEDLKFLGSSSLHDYKRTLNTITTLKHLKKIMKKKPKTILMIKGLSEATNKVLEQAEKLAKDSGLDWEKL